MSIEAPRGVLGIDLFTKSGGYACGFGCALPSNSMGLLSRRMLLPSTSTSVAFDLAGAFTACIARLEGICCASYRRSPALHGDLHLLDVAQAS